MTNKEKIGYYGERVVASLLNGRLSKDPYDRKKDMVIQIDNKNGEVKTQIRYKNEKAFTVNMSQTNQLKKCIEVDRLFFVEYGTSGYVRVYECIDRSYRIVYGGGRQMAAFDIGKMKLIYDKKTPLAEELVRLSTVIEKSFLDDSYLYQQEV